MYRQIIETFFLIALMEYHFSDEITVVSRDFGKRIELVRDEIVFVLGKLAFGFRSVMLANSKQNVCHEHTYIIVDDIVIDARAPFERVP